VQLKVSCPRTQFSELELTFFCTFPHHVFSFLEDTTMGELMIMYLSGG
jgi:hypothetical protein